MSQMGLKSQGEVAERELAGNPSQKGLFDGFCVVWGAARMCKGGVKSTNHTCYC